MYRVDKCKTRQEIYTQESFDKFIEHVIELATKPDVKTA